MSIIKVTVDDQALYVTESPVVAAQGVNENYFQFTLSSDWSGFGVVALFWKEGNEDTVYESVVDGTGKALVPHEMTDLQGRFCVGLAGTKGDIIHTSEVLKYKVVKGRYTAGQGSEPPTPGIYEQMLSLAGEMREAFSEAVTVQGAVIEQIRTEQATLRSELTTEQETFEDRITGQVDTFIGDHSGTYGQTTLWTSSDTNGIIGKDTTITLSESVESYDYVDIYSFNGDKNEIATIPVDSVLTQGEGYAIRTVNVSTSTVKMNIVESRITIVGTVFTIVNEYIYQAGQSNPVHQITQDNKSSYVGAFGITKVVGRKLVENAEVADIRVGENGTTYQTAGAAVRGQFSAVKAQIPLIDASLATTGKAADAKATGDALATVNGRLGEFCTDLDLLEFSDYDSNSSDYVHANTSMFPSASFGTSANYTVLAFIPVRKGDKVFYTGATGTNTGIAIANTYTTNDTSGYYSTLASGDGNTYTNREFDITDDKIKYVACCFRTAENVPYRVVVIHSDTMLWHEVQALSDNLYEAQIPKSFFNIIGYYNNADYVSSTSRYMKVYDVSKYDKVELSGTFGSYANVYTLLDADLSVVRYVRNNSANNRQFDLNVDTSDGSWLYVGTMVSIADTLALTAYSAEIDTQYYQHMNGSPQMGFYHDAEWNATSSAPTLLFAVLEGESVIVTGNADSWFNLYTFTDDNGNVKTYQRSLSGETTLHLVVPNGATRLYVASSAANTASLFVFRVKHFEGNPTNWTGKKIVWFGTSIPAAGYIGDTTENSYPKYIADMLGADIYNEAVGSSNVHCKQPDRVNAETNPYGFIGNFESVSRCLSNTTAEMQWIIDNYDSSIWTSGKVSSMPDVLKNQILANSYQTKLDKYLTAKTFPDLFVFDHGHNDPFNSLAVENEYYTQYGEYSTYSFRGSMNFLIQRILNFNPYAKIVMIGEYTGKESDQIPTMQMQVATDWNIPICKDWRKLGWTKTKTIVVNGNWVKNGNTYVWTPTDNPTTMSMFARWIPDGIHPHTDPSNKALRHMADVIGQWLDNDICKTS